METREPISPRRPTLLHFSPLRNPLAPHEDHRLCSGEAERRRVAGRFTRAAGLRERNALGVHTGPGQRARSTLRSEVERSERLESGGEREREAGREAVASSVGVGDARRLRRRRVRAPWLGPPAETACRRHHEPRPGIEVATVLLSVVLPACDECVELDRRLAERSHLPRRGDEDAGSPRTHQSIGVAGAEVRRIAPGELVPRKRVVVAARMELASDGDDRSLPHLVEEREAAPLAPVDCRRMDLDALRLELLPRPFAALVRSESREEDDLVRELRELCRSDRTPTRRLLPRLGCMDDLALARHVLDAHELEPLHVPDHGRPHTDMLTDPGPGALKRMMQAVAIPPFERFYQEHRTEVLRLLRRRLGSDRAEDAFQETFLRALRAYPRLDHGEHLRAWVLIIAQNVAVDTLRRTRPQTELVETGVADRRPAYAELADLTDGLSTKERAAVVLRYGYDLSYDQIAEALGSSPDAARQATSMGVRRLRRRTTT